MTVLDPPRELELTLDERVANGIAYLDERLPGWRERLDLSDLWMGDDCRCVLGQTAGGYFNALHDLSITHEQSDRLGFSVFFFHDVNLLNYSDLTAAWKRALT